MTRRRHAGRTLCLLLVWSWPLVSAAQENERPSGVFLVDIQPSYAVAPWKALALEHNIVREILGYQDIQVLDKRDLDVTACESTDSWCRLILYGRAGVDFFMSGTAGPDYLRYEIFECWTPSRLMGGSFSLDARTSMNRLKQRVLTAVAPIMGTGGLLEEKKYLEQRRLFPPSLTPTGDKDEHRIALGIVFAAAALFFAIPVLLGRLGGARGRLRSGRWILPVVVLSGGLAVHCWTDLLTGLWGLLDPDSLASGFMRMLAERMTSWEWLIAIVGGVAWGGFGLSVLKTAFPLIGGMDRIGHRDVMRMLRVWLTVCAQRILLLTAFYAPFGLLFWWVSTWFPQYQRVFTIILAPLTGLGLRAWFLALVENAAGYLDRRLVEGPATGDNPWHHDVKSYFQGYLNRTGLSVEPKLLNRIRFLPGQNDSIVTYGGGSTHPRVVIPTRLLLTAIGDPEEVPPESRFLPWSNWLGGTVIQNQEVQGAERSSRAVTALLAIWRVLAWILKPIVALFARRHVPDQRSGRRKMLGQAATSLGYVVPFPPEELVPLIADDPEDFEVVRELLAEHYAWFETDPDDVSDDTDPTDRDFLFGLLVRETGRIEREEGQLIALLKAARFSGGFEWLGTPGRMIAGIGRRLFSTAPARLADGYVALNLARHHLVQYLYLVGLKLEDLLTERADGLELQQVSMEIFKRTALSEIEDVSIRNRIAWLSQFFHTGLHIPGRRWLRILVGTCLGLGVLGGAFFLIKQAVDFHPTYVQRIAEQKQKIEESRHKTEHDDKGNAENG